jgi:hypothetical protein
MRTHGYRFATATANAERENLLRGSPFAPRPPFAQAGEP